MKILGRETANAILFDWFTKSMYCDHPNCILIASLREDESLELLDEINTEFLYSNCLECIYYSKEIESYFLCEKHKLLYTDDNVIVKSWYELLIADFENKGVVDAIRAGVVIPTI
jgi:hypothetical protein